MKAFETAQLTRETKDAALATEQNIIVTWMGEGKSEPAVWLKTSGTGHQVVRLANGVETALDRADKIEWVDCYCSKEPTPVSHLGSPRCRSHGLAAGGYRAHCTCDTCF